MAYRYRTVKRGGKTVLLHRHVMAEHLGRALLPTEHVHHKEARFQNDPTELEVLDAAAHRAHHADERLIHPRSKPCQVCGTVFTPHATKRKRQKTCSRPCRDALIAKTERETKARKKVAAAIARAQFEEQVIEVAA